MNTNPLHDYPMNYQSGKQTVPLQLIRPLESVALLIDGENMASEQIDQIMAEAEKLGNVTVRRVYGNWNELANWNSAASQYALEPVHTITVRSCKNGADIALAIGVMDLFYTNAIKRFCIVTTDCDYLPLVMKLRREGCVVLGIGKPETPKLLQDAYSRFVSTAHLSPSPSQLPQPSPMQPPPLKNFAVDEPTRVNLLMEAYRNALAGGGGEWLSIQRLGSELRCLVADTPLYKALFRKKGLTMVVKEHDDLFEIREQGQDRHLEVRPRGQDADETTSKVMIPGLRE